MGKLTIQEIAKILVEKNGLDQKAANRFATEMFAVVLERLQQGEQVKVKGLGTWKIIDVEARESVSVRTGERVVIDGHSKVSFTPDATMKELVNRPFSQFETVVLNDGVEFEDLKDDLTDEELKEEASLSLNEESVAIPEESTVISEEPMVISEEPTVIPEEPTVIPEEPLDLDEESHWGKWLLCGLGILALMAASAWSGYYYGSSKKTALAPDTVVVKDTVYVASSDSLLGVAPQEQAPQTIVEPQPAEPVTDPYAA
jgi:nucleoid DNA-binding protein